MLLLLLISLLHPEFSVVNTLQEKILNLTHIILDYFFHKILFISIFNIIVCFIPGSIGKDPKGKTKKKKQNKNV